MNSVDKAVASINESIQEAKQEINEYWTNPDMVLDDKIQDITSTLLNIHFQIAELQRIKETLEPQLAEMLNHGDDGSKTYTVGRFKVTAKSGWIYSLNKDEYVTMGSRIPACFNPVSQRISYDLNKNVIRDAEKYASPGELELIATMISKKPAKLHISIKAGI